MLTEHQKRTKVDGRYGNKESAEYVIKRSERCIRGYMQMIDPIRKVAKQFGYAIAQHGSLARDIDLVAIPWTEEAVEAPILVEAIVAVVRAYDINGFVKVDNDCPRPKPHGRQCWSIHFTGGPYLDLSVMPRVI